MKKSTKIIGIIAIAAIAVLFISYYIKAPVSTEIVRGGVLEDSVTVDGFVAQDERLIVSDYSGSLQNVVLEGETVAKGQTVAVVYQGKVDQKIQNALTAVQQKIDELEAADSTLTDGDETKIETQVKNTIDEMIEASNQRQYDVVRDAQADIYQLSDKLQVITGNAQPTTLEQLQSEKAALEQQINLASAQLVAPESGVYSSHIDGLENLVDYQNVSDLTVADYEKLENATATVQNEVTAGQPVAKVIHDFDWQFITVVDAQAVEGKSAGDALQIRIPDYSEDTYSAQITAINPDGNGQALLVVSCNKASSFVSSNRNITADLIFEQYSGLKIPESALQEVNSVQGVYVKEETFLTFKEVEVLAQRDGYAIVREDNANEDGLLLYDEVVTGGRNLYEGKVVV